MKKWRITAAVLMLAFVLAACSGGSAEGPDAAENTASVRQESTEDGAKIKSYMGQVSDKIGNDITVSLGELILEGGDDGGAAYYVDENGAPHLMEEGEFNAENAVTIMVPMPEDAAGEGTDSGAGEGPAERLPIEFTGEVREFTIPAGAKITNAMGKELGLDSVVTGSLVQLIVNETTGVVEHLMVM